MRITELFTKSLYSLKAISFFRFQKIEKTISYLFILSFFVSLPTLFLFFLSFFNKGLAGFDEMFQLPGDPQGETIDGPTAGIIPVFIFLAILFIILGVSMIQFITVSLLAAIGLLLKKAFGRRLDYKHLWNMSAYVVTLPSVLIGLSVLLPFSLPLPGAIYFTLSFMILVLSIRNVPIPKIRK